MSPRRKLWSKSVGSYGSKVEIRERTIGGNLYIRAGSVWESLGHRDREAAEKRAKEISGDLLAAKESLRKGARPLSYVFARYEREESRFKAQPGEDARRIDVWNAFFETERVHDARMIAPAHIRRFERLRRAGKIKVKDRELRANPSETTIGADIIFLHTVLNWATTAQEGEGRLLVSNPIVGYQIPKTKNPLRPVATFDRFVRVYRQTDKVDAQKLFRSFFALIGNELDWRVSAVCAIRISEIDFNSYPDAPAGRLYKNPLVDKENVGGWIPLTPRARRALQRAVRRRGAIGDVYLFESPKRPGQPWRRQHARDLLERAETLAQVGHVEGGDFHPYRRKWSTERKHHAWADIAAVSGRKDRDTFEKSYTAADAAGMLAVVNEPRRLREQKGAEKASNL